MFWTLIILSLFVFICAFFLVRRMYTSKPKKSEETSQTLDEGMGETAEADGGE